MHVDVPFFSTMELKEFIEVLEDIEAGGSPKIDYGLHEGIRTILSEVHVGRKPATEFFKRVLAAERPYLQGDDEKARAEAHHKSA